MKNVLITGGAGFIGSNFVRFLLARHDGLVVNLDALTYAGNLENLQDVAGHPNYRFVKGDICDAKLVDALFDRYAIDTVVHFAAESHVDRSITDPQAFVSTNVLGAQILLDAAKRHWSISPTDARCSAYRDEVRFLQVSTDEVYGALGESGLFTESTPLAPSSPYSASKAAADHLARAYFKTFGLPVNITRCSNNYGPYQFPEKLIPLMIHNAMQNQKLPVYGDGGQVRDWLHVGDHCAAIDLVLRKGVPGEVYNIGGNNERTNLEIVQQILAALGKSQSLITHVADRPGHDRRYAIDSTKITRQLGWRPAVSFAQGMAETIQWYQAHAEWLEHIASGAYRQHDA